MGSPSPRIESVGFVPKPSASSSFPNFGHRHSSSITSPLLHPRPTRPHHRALRESLLVCPLFPFRLWPGAFTHRCHGHHLAAGGRLVGPPVQPGLLPSWSGR